MKKKVILDEAQICQEYISGRDGVETLCKKYHVGKLRIKDILKKHNIEFKKRGKQELKEDFVVSDWGIEKYPLIDGFYYIAIDNNNGFTTKDYMNAAGVLTTHIKKCYNVDIPSLYDRRMYYMKTGNYWWEQWFEIQKKENRVTKKCPYCDWDLHLLNKKYSFISKNIQK